MRAFTKYILLIILWLFCVSNVFAQGNSIPNYESFETDLGVWQQSTSDDIDWTRYSGATPTDLTGPSAASDGSYYLYIENDPNLYNPSRSADLIANFDFSSASMPILSLDYHMYGEDVTWLGVYVSLDTGKTWVEAQKIIGDQGDLWHNMKVCLGDYIGYSDVLIKISTVTGEVGNKCDIAIDNIQIVDFALANSSITDVTCGGYSDGAIYLEVSGGFEPYAFSITDGVTYVDNGANKAYTFSNLSGGDYLVNVKSGECVLDLGVYTVNEPPSPSVSVNKDDNDTCAYISDGRIAIATSGGDQPFTFSIDGGNTFVTDSVFNDLDTGTYTVMVKDTKGCVFNQGDYHIDALYEINIIGYEITNVEGCYGEKTGSITVNVNGGHQPLEFSIDTGGIYQNSNYFPDLAADDYIIIIKDSQGCKDTTDVLTVTEPPQLVINSVSYTDVDGCHGDSTGTITINASGGTPSLFYSIDAGASYAESTSYFDSLPAGNYVIYVKDSHDCLAGPDTVVITEPDLLLITNVTKTDIANCYGDSTGTIDIDATGGTGQYLYSVDSGATFQVLDLFDNLPAGVYYPIVKDQKNCIAQADAVELKQPPQLQIVSVSKLDVLGCYGDATGEIQLSVTGGTTPYEYSIDSGNTYQGSNDFVTLVAGVYYPFARDNNGCIATSDSIVITQPPQVVILEETASDALCYGSYNGHIYVNAEGGTGKLYFSVDAGTNYPYRVGDTIDVPAGSYDIMVRDENMCTATGSNLVVNEPAKLVIDTVIITDVDGCYGDSTGTMKIIASGGTSPYKYSIDGGITLRDTNFFDSLPFGTNYYPYVRDVNGCYYLDESKTVNQPNQLYIASVSHTDVEACNGVPAGTITISAGGGTKPLYFSVDSGATFPQDTGFFDNLYAGWYNAAVKDSKGCKAYYSSPIYINEPPVMKFDSVIVDDITCNGAQNGHIKIYAQGGKPQLFYSIDDVNFVPAYEFFTLSAGNYHITVRDYYQCTIDTNVTINEPDALVIDTIITTDIETCYGDSSGTIQVQAHGGFGQIYYAYSRSGYNSPYGTDNYFQNLPAGSYYVRIKDDNDCELASEPFKINQPDPVYIDSYQKTGITCYNDNDAQVSIQAYGGTGYLAYSIDSGMTWQYGDSIFTNLGPGDYRIVVKDANECFAGEQPAFTITQPDSLMFDTVYVSNVSCYGYQDGKLIGVVAGGTYPYEYSLDASTYQSSNIFTDLATGTYEMYVRDSHGCLARSRQYTITMPPNYAEFTIDTNIGCPPLEVKFTPMYPDASYAWEFGDGTVSSVQSPVHTYYNDSSYTYTYRAMAIASKGVCRDTFTRDIQVYPKPHLDFTLDPEIAYYPDTTIGITNNTPFYDNYHWDFGDGTTADVTYPVEHAYSTCGTYTISVTAQNTYQCIDTMAKDVTINTVLPQSSFTIDQFEGCAPLTVEFYNNSSNAVGYIWDFGDGDTAMTVNATHTFTQDGTFLVRLTALGYCNTSSSSEQLVYSYPQPIADFYVDPDTVAIGQIVGFFNSSVDGKYYIWDFGDGNSSQDENPRYAYSKAGVFDVQLVVQSENGCVDTVLKPESVYVLGDVLFLLPTAFTPDGDGTNDLFVPQGNMIKRAEIWIYDRYSNLVFHTTNWDTEFWDGTDLMGRKLPQDVYIVKVVGEYINGQQFMKISEVTLLR